MANPKMTRAHFELIARAFKVSRPLNRALPGYPTWQHSVHVMADALDRTNDHFDHQRFYAACEGE